MALRAGYRGIKKSLANGIAALIQKYEDALVIKSIGSGLDLSEDGELTASAVNVDYSTTEQKTGMKWIDGSDIYFKVIECGVLTNSSGETAKDVNHGIDNFGLFIKCEGSWNVSGESPVGGAVPMTNNGLSITVQADASKVVLWYRGDFSDKDVNVVLYYTKVATQNTRRKTIKKEVITNGLHCKSDQNTT